MTIETRKRPPVQSRADFLGNPDPIRDPEDYALYDAAQERWANEEVARPPTLRVLPSRELLVVSSLDVPVPDEHEPPSVLDPLFPPLGQTVLLVGQFSQGKTVFSRRCGRAWAAGEGFAGLTAPQPYRVLYYDLESPERKHRLYNVHMRPHPNLFFVREVPEALRLNYERGRAHFENRLNAGIDIVVIDPLPKYWRVSDESNQMEADEQMSILSDIARRTNTLILSIVNMGWTAKRIRGASSRGDRADMVINYTGDKGTPRRTLKVEKSREDNLFMEHHIQFAGEYDFELVSGAAVLTPTSHAHTTREAIVELLQLNPAGFTRANLLARLSERSENEVDKALAALKASGTIAQKKKGHPYKLTGGS